MKQLNNNIKIFLLYAQMKQLLSQIMNKINKKLIKLH